MSPPHTRREQRPCGGKSSSWPLPSARPGPDPGPGSQTLSLLPSSPQGCGTGLLRTTILRMKMVNQREITRQEERTLAWLPVLTSLSPWPAGLRPQTPPPRAQVGHTPQKSHTGHCPHTPNTWPTRPQTTHREGPAPPNSTKQY